MQAYAKTHIFCGEEMFKHLVRWLFAILSGNWMLEGVAMINSYI